VPDDAERARLDQLQRALLDRGVLISPTGLGCLSTAVTEAEIEYFLEVANSCIGGG
jgi:glutamate-1-semialdehyde aminotransferase